MDEFLTKKEVAEALKIPKRTLDYLVYTDQIPFFRVGKRSVRFAADRLKEWARERESVELKYSKQKSE